MGIADGFASRVAQTVLDGRALAEARMLTTCLIQYKTGLSELDPITGSQTPVYETAFETKCRIKSSGFMIHQSEAGGRTSGEVTRSLHIPVTSADPWADPRSANAVTALITAVHPTDDPTLLGARLTLDGPSPGSQTTARRLQVTEVVS